MEAITGFVDGFGALITDAFGLLVYAPATGLTDIATWSLVFGGIALCLGIINRFVRA